MSMPIDTPPVTIACPNCHQNYHGAVRPWSAADERRRLGATPEALARLVAAQR